MITTIQVKDKKEAFELINQDYPASYVLDPVSTERAGYKIYRSEEEYYSYICDLGCRLELNLSNNDTVNYYWQKPSFDYKVNPQYTKRNVSFRQYHA